MFSISELFLTLIIVLLVLGPKRLLIVARQSGIWLGFAKRRWQHLQTELGQYQRQLQFEENQARAAAAENSTKNE